MIRFARLSGGLIGIRWDVRTYNFTSTSGRDTDGFYTGQPWSQRWDDEFTVTIGLGWRGIRIVWRRPCGNHWLGRGNPGIRSGPHPDHDRIDAIRYLPGTGTPA